MIHIRISPQGNTFSQNSSFDLLVGVMPTFSQNSSFDLLVGVIPKKLFEITILGTCVFPAAVFGCESRTILRSIKYKIGLLGKNSDPLSLTLTHMSPGFNLPYTFHARVVLKLSTLGYTGSRSLRFCISCINTHMLH